MTGPLPPAIGGMSTVINDISQSSLAKKIDLVLLNTAKTTTDGRSLWTAVMTRITLLLKCARLLRQNKNSILHIHTCSGFTYFLDGSILIIGKLLGVPVILHVHGGRFDSFLQELPAIGSLIAKWLARQATSVVVLSDSWQTTLSPLLPKANIEIIENGVPLLNREYISYKKKDCVQILFLGNLSKNKGVWDLLEAAELVSQKFHLVYAGGESETELGIAQQLQAHADKGSLKNKYTWLGPVHAEAKNTLFLETDIFILPSYIEGLPISLLEAMCASLPVIVTPVGGIPSVVTNEVEGFIVTPGDIKGLASAIDKLVSNSSLRTDMGLKAFKRCSEKYNIERVADRYMDLYQSLS